MTSRSATERANIELIEAFVKEWEAPDYDPQIGYAKYLSPDAVVQMAEEFPITQGADAAIAAIKGFMDAGGRIVKADFDDIYACGPIVVTSRTDIVKLPEKDGETFAVAAVFIVKNGKITDWKEYAR